MENALYSAVHRLTWAASMAWIPIAGGRRAFGKTSNWFGSCRPTQNCKKFSRIPVTATVFILYQLLVVDSRGYCKKIKLVAVPTRCPAKRRRTKFAVLAHIYE